MAPRTARLVLDIRDEEGRPLPCRVDWWEQATGFPVYRVWSGTGEVDFEVPAAALSLLVRRGFDYDAVALDLDLSGRWEEVREVILRRRFDARALGWHGGENHLHVLHAPQDETRTIADAGPMAEAEGLDYIQLAHGWDPSFAWLPVEELEQQCRTASTGRVRVGWNIEAKTYMGPDHGGREGNLHCFGHGWTAGLKDHAPGQAFFHTGPMFRIIQEVRRQGGAMGCAHPTRFWFVRGNFVSNWPSELPFDFVAGAPYDAVDVLNDSPLVFAESLRFWYTLLNLGYKVAGTANTDGHLAAATGLGRYRTYVHIEGSFSWEGLVAALRAGRAVASSGPFVLFEVEGHLPGAEFPADGRQRRVSLKAWSSPLPGETLTAVQLVRNGEVVRAWDLRAEQTRYWEIGFEIAETEFAWYCAQVLSTCRDPGGQSWGPHAQERAVANPVYFLPSGFARPAPTPAQLSLSVCDPVGRPLAALVSILDGWIAVGEESVPASGQIALILPATASLSISASGHQTAERTLYLDCPELCEYCRDLGAVWPSFFSPEPYLELRRRLDRLRLKVVLQPADRQ